MEASCRGFFWSLLAGTSMFVLPQNTTLIVVLNCKLLLDVFSFINIDNTCVHNVLLASYDPVNYISICSQRMQG